MTKPDSFINFISQITFDSTEDGITAAGTTQSAATQLNEGLNIVDTATAGASDSVKLPTLQSTTSAGSSTLGMTITIYNNSSSPTIQVFPSSGNSINQQSNNAAHSLPRQSICIYKAISSTEWISMPSGTNPQGWIGVIDGITALSATVGIAKLYVDTSDGDLKIIFGDGTVKTITTD